MKLTCETFISKGGCVYEISPTKMERLCQNIGIIIDKRDIFMQKRFSD